MGKPSDSDEEWRRQRDRIIGLGERSVHKSYYPALRRNLTELKNLLQAVEQASVGILITNRDGVIEFANPAACAVLGDPDGAWTGTAVRALRAEEHPDDQFECIWAALQSGSAWRGETPYRRRNGDVSWGQISVTPIRDESGCVTHYATILDDISARRAVDERLRMAAKVFSASHNGIVITDAHAVILDVNSAFEAMTGYGPEDAIGRKPSILRSDRHDTEFFSRMWNALLTRGHWEGEIWNRRKNGDVYPQQTSISAMRGDGGVVSHYVGIFTDITERKAAEARIRYLAYHDDLTGLPNRVSLAKRFSGTVEASRRSGLPFALLYVDLDRFKNVNDNLGHSFGDTILKAAAERLRNSLNVDDTVFRHGGDEFIVLTGPLSGAEAAASVARGIMATMAEPYQISGYELSVPASIGVVLFPDHGPDLETLLRRGDTAMYQAKRLGRCRFQFFDETMDERAREFFRLENALRGALRRGEFNLHYQPEVELADGRWVGVEALLRWTTPDLGPVCPDRFIPIAEETGLILPIGAWVLEQACLQAAAWHRAGVGDFRVAINLSMMQFRQDDLADMVRAALAQANLPPHSLELEVTESVLMVDADHTINTLAGLRAIGVGLAIDDFGTGYSSLAYLKRFPVSKLKIDKSFVRELTTVSDDARICRAIIGLADTFHLQAVAEGIETPEQRRWLHEAGCRLGQGFLFSKPVPAQELPW